MFYNLEKIAKEVGGLAPLSSSLDAILDLSHEDEFYFEKLVKIIKSDPGLITTLTDLEEFVRTPEETTLAGSVVSDIESLLSRVGADSFVGAILTKDISETFFPKNNYERDLWIHSVQVAVISMELAKLGLIKGVKPKTAYLCGLVHDMGSFILVDLAPHMLREVDEITARERIKKTIAEQMALGYDHAELGYKIGTRMGLNKKIMLVVKGHHDNDFTSKPQYDEETKALALVIQVSDFCASLILQNKNNFSDEKIYNIFIDKIKERGWERYNLNVNKIIETAKSLKGQIEKAIPDFY